MVAVQKVVMPDLEQNSDANEQVIQAKTQGTDKGWKTVRQQQQNFRGKRLTITATDTLSFNEDIRNSSLPRPLSES